MLQTVKSYIRFPVKVKTLMALVLDNNERIGQFADDVEELKNLTGIIEDTSCEVELLRYDVKELKEQLTAIKVRSQK